MPSPTAQERAAEIVCPYLIRFHGGEGKVLMESITAALDAHADARLEEAALLTDDCDCPHCAFTGRKIRSLKSRREEK